MQYYICYRLYPTHLLVVRMVFHNPEERVLWAKDHVHLACRAVADELIRHGVSPDRLEVVAMSDSSPVYQEWMPSGEAGNRRAEVFIDY